MKKLRTPDERFENLPGYPFKPNYVSIPDDDVSLRIHYIDEGPSTADPVLQSVPGVCEVVATTFMLELFDP